MSTPLIIFLSRYGSPTIGTPSDNCLLADWPIPEMDPRKHFVEDPGCELYHRGSYGHGCELDKVPLGRTPLYGGGASLGGGGGSLGGGGGYGLNSPTYIPPAPSSTFLPPVPTRPTFYPPLDNLPPKPTSYLPPTPSYEKPTPSYAPPISSYPAPRVPPPPPLPPPIYPPAPPARPQGRPNVVPIPPVYGPGGTNAYLPPNDYNHPSLRPPPPRATDRSEYILIFYNLVSTYLSPF